MGIVSSQPFKIISSREAEARCFLSFFFFFSFFFFLLIYYYCCLFLFLFVFFFRYRTRVREIQERIPSVISAHFEAPSH